MTSSKLFLYIAITVLVAFLCKMFYANILAPNMEGMRPGGNTSRSGGRNPVYHGRPPYTYRTNTNVIYTGGGYGGYYDFPIYGYYYDPAYVYPNNPVVVRNDVQDQYTMFLFMMFFFAILAIMVIA